MLNRSITLLGTMVTLSAASALFVLEPATKPPLAIPGLGPGAPYARFCYTFLVAGPAFSLVSQQPPTKQSPSKPSSAPTGEKKDVAGQKGAAKAENDRLTEKRKQATITDKQLLELRNQCRSMARASNDLEATLAAARLYDHLGLVYPLNKSGTYFVGEKTRIVKYAPDRVQLVSRSGEGHDMVNSKFAYACDRDGQWKPIDPRRMNEYRLVAVRSAKTLFVLDLEKDTVMAVKLEPKARH